MNILSIIIPAFNTDKYLSACLDSIVSQIYNDIEVIIVNDGSTDNSGHIAEKYAQRYDFIKVIQQSNQGVSAARNIAIQESKGQYLVFLDSDDILYKGFFQKILELIGSHPDIIEINADLIDKIGNLLYKKVFSLDNKKTNFNNTDEAKLRLSKQAKYYLWSRIIKRDLVRHLYFDERIDFCEDALYLTECYFEAKKIITFNESLYGYRQHDSNLTVAKTSKNIYQLAILHDVVVDKIDSIEKEHYKKYLIPLLLNTIHLRKSMYAIQFRKIVCDDVTLRQISHIRNSYKWSFFCRNNSIAWIRQFSLSMPKLSNIIILIKQHLKNILILRK